MHADKTARRRRSTVQSRGSTHPRRLSVSTEAVFLVVLKHVSIDALTMKKLEGIIAPMATAITHDEKIDAKTTRTLVDFLIDGGIDGLFPLGTSGEFALFDREERKNIIDTVVDQTNGRVPVLAGVSDPSLENVLAFAKDAEDAGADAIVATPPYYYATGEEGLFNHFETIARKSGLPLVVYNIPEWTHLFVPPSVIQRLAERRLVVGTKESGCHCPNLLPVLKVA